jgi:hypothetical protein
MQRRSNLPGEVKSYRQTTGPRVQRGKFAFEPSRRYLRDHQIGVHLVTCAARQRIGIPHRPRGRWSRFRFMPHPKGHADDPAIIDGRSVGRIG